MNSTRNILKSFLCIYLQVKEKLAKVQSEELPALIEKAAASGLPEDAQAVNDLTAICNRFEKKIPTRVN